MKKNFFRSSLAKTLVMSMFFAFFLSLTNTVMAQSLTKEGQSVFQTELATLKQQVDAANSFTATVASQSGLSEISLRYDFYSLAYDAIEKEGVSVGVQKTHDLFTENGNKPSALVNQIRDDLLQLLN